MVVTYENYADLQSHDLGSIAIELRQLSQKSTRLSPLILMTDPKRLPHLAETLAHIPDRSAIIYRHFGHENRHKDAILLREVTFKRSQQLLIGGGDISLAQSIKADGVHFSRHTEMNLIKKTRRDHPNWIISLAALKKSNLSPNDYGADIACLDALIVSSIFSSQSPSAGEAIGVDVLSSITKKFPIAIIAMGGITLKTAPQLIGSGAAGLAAIDGLKQRLLRITR